MNMTEACVACLSEKYRDKAPAGASPEQRTAYREQVLRVIDENRHLSAPETVELIENVYVSFFGPLAEFTEQKIYFNNIMLALEPHLQKQAESAPDPPKCAVQFAMAGNFIDFGAMKNVEDEQLKRFLESAHSSAVDPAVLEQLRREIVRARRMVFFTDNCGEIVADKVLMRVMRLLNPNLHVTSVVRGAPALNDATAEDAAQVRLSEACDAVLDNGCGIAGTVLSRLPYETALAVQQADFLLSKGQGNFETLSGCGLNLYYIFLCKCPLFVERFGVPRFSGILIRERENG